MFIAWSALTRRVYEELVKAIWEFTHKGILVTLLTRSHAPKTLQVFI